jgi:chromosomal replication initiation ATPase DnaA
LVPDKDEIISTVNIEYKVSISDLRISKRGQMNEPRNVAMYLMRYLRGDTLSEICKEFGLKKYSSAGSIVGRVNKQIKKEKRLRIKVENIKKRISKS